MKQQSRIGIFGGSFDPVHCGHLILAREAMELFSLEKVLFLPARVSPHKAGRPPEGAEERMGLLAAAIEGEEGFFLDGRELERGGVSYAIDTVRELESENPGAHFFFFVGEDNLPELHTWREIGELRERVDFVVFARGGEVERRDGMFFVGRKIEISSTEIRNRVAQGRSIRYLVPERVNQLIKEKKLYVRGERGS